MRPKSAAKRGHPLKAVPIAGDHPINSGSARKIIFRRILVAVDFSDCSGVALDYADALAADVQARLIFLHVIEPAVHLQNDLNPALADPNQRTVEAAQKRLAVIAQKREGRCRQIDVLVRIGRAYSEITDTARAMAADLIVVGTHGFNGVENPLMGSTAERVVRHAPCPVLIVRGGFEHSSPSTH
jgi:nucleotide-binding universal stress UspA family protein